jgi:hypothetical protein
MLTEELSEDLKREFLEGGPGETLHEEPAEELKSIVLASLTEELDEVREEVKQDLKQDLKPQIAKDIKEGIKRELKWDFGSVMSKALKAEYTSACTPQDLKVLAEEVRTITKASLTE